jgi:hypothetical protein
METCPMILLRELNKSTHIFQKFPNTPMYTTKGDLDTLVVRLSLVPFATNGTYGHDCG